MSGRRSGEQSRVPVSAHHHAHLPGAGRPRCGRGDGREVGAVNDTVEKRDLKWTLAWFTSSDGVSLKDHEVFTVIFTCIEELAQKAATLQAAYDVLAGGLRGGEGRRGTPFSFPTHCLGT